MSALLDDVGRVVGGIGIVEDKTSEKRAYEQINYISLHDPLRDSQIGDATRSHMSMVLTNPKNRDHTQYYSIWISPNFLSRSTDTFGHTVGDKLLLEVAKRIFNL